MLLFFFFFGKHCMNFYRGGEWTFLRYGQKLPLKGNVPGDQQGYLFRLQWFCSLMMWLYFPARVRTFRLSVTDNALLSQWVHDLIRIYLHPSTCRLNSNICWGPCILVWWKEKEVKIQLYGGRNMNTATELDLATNNYLYIIWMA